jgi:hypothetical protein
MAEGLDSQENKYTVKKFDGTDFATWRFKVEVALNANQCSEAIKASFKTEESDTEEAKNLSIF